MAMRIDGAPLNMPTLPSATKADRAPSTSTMPPIGIAPKGSLGNGQALEGVTMLKDPDLGFLPSFLSGKKYKDLDLPLTGKTTPGSFDKEIWVPHVRQGALGDCWLMGTLASMALAKDPTFQPAIRRVDNDTVALKFGDREMGVSDSLPVKRDGKLLFGRQNMPHFTATWPVYYEKAAAAIMGGYAALEGGWPSEAFELFLGKAPEDISAPKDIIGFIGTAVDAGLPVAITTRSEQTEAMDEVGIHSNHTYAVRKTITMTRSGEPVVGVKLWNPWGHEHPRPLTPEQFEAFADSVATPDETFKW